MEEKREQKEKAELYSSCLPPVGSFSAGNMSPDQILHAATAVTMPAKPKFPMRAFLLKIKILNACVTGLDSFWLSTSFLQEGKRGQGERERKREIVYLEVRSNIQVKKQHLHQRMFVNMSVFSNSRGREKRNCFQVGGKGVLLTRDCNARSRAVGMIIEVYWLVFLLETMTRKQWRFKSLANSLVFCKIFPKKTDNLCDSVKLEEVRLSQVWLVLPHPNRTY